MSLVITTEKKKIWRSESCVHMRLVLSWSVAIDIAVLITSLGPAYPDFDPPECA